MVMPLYDHSPFKWARPPYVTWVLIAVNVIVFLLQIATATDRSDAIDQAAALVPAAFTDTVLVRGEAEPQIDGGVDRERNGR